MSFLVDVLRQSPTDFYILNLQYGSIFENN
jgi:hypothetical protein